MAWNDNLTGDALRIAGNLNSPLRVVAGPGTGKTFALIRRVARLLEEGEEPRRILVCTFTRTAADDLSKEISRLRVEGATEIVAGTLHAFFFVFYREQRSSQTQEEFQDLYLTSRHDLCLRTYPISEV